MRAKQSANRIRDLITLIVFGEKNMLWSFSCRIVVFHKL
jgi:hypothetical protein